MLGVGHMVCAEDARAGIALEWQKIQALTARLGTVSPEVRKLHRLAVRGAAEPELRAASAEAREVVRPGQGDRSPRGDRSESSGDRADHDEGAQAAGPGRATGRAATG